MTTLVVLAALTFQQPFCIIPPQEPMTMDQCREKLRGMAKQGKSGACVTERDLHNFKDCYRIS